jgi:hypothetical protein
MEQLSPCAEQASFDVSIQGDVRAAESVDRLLRIADKEELSRYRMGGSPICDGVSVGGK